ncbi:MAG: hypothetical protein ACR2NB_02415 [Solirubrobacteraceae bacterium]
MTRRAVAVLVLVLALAAPASAQDRGKPVVGGGSFNTAPLLTTGRYSDTVAAGETVYWKIRLQKGQVLRATTTVDTSSIETDRTKGDFDEGLYNLDYRLDIHSPLREPYSNESDYRDASADVTGDTGAESVTGTATSPRVLGFEQVLGPDFSVDKFTAPGETFVSLSAADSGTYPAAAPAELSVALELRIDGAPQPSSADFAAKLPRSKPAPPERDTTGTAAGSRAPPTLGASGEGDPTVTIVLVASLALLGGLVLSLLAALTLRSRRRAGAAGPASP